ncbi:hypothetical protein FOZ62_028070, partial [Perkinsus olseni]
MNAPVVHRQIELITVIDSRPLQALFIEVLLTPKRAQGLDGYFDEPIDVAAARFSSLMTNSEDLWQIATSRPYPYVNGFDNGTQDAPAGDPGWWSVSVRHRNQPWGVSDFSSTCDIEGSHQEFDGSALPGQQFGSLVYLGNSSGLWFTWATVRVSGLPGQQFGFLVALVRLLFTSPHGNFTVLRSPLPYPCRLSNSWSDASPTISTARRVPACLERLMKCFFLSLRNCLDDTTSFGEYV